MIIKGLEDQEGKTSMTRKERRLLPEEEYDGMVLVQMEKAFHATSGVPRDSHWWPLSFLIYSQNLLRELGDTEALLYADGLKLYRAMQNSGDVVLLQAHLSRIAQ